ncbi:MAG: hypothetical protein AB1793_09540, partial [Candidatus Thermoplasmatota archaeon]
MARVVDSTGAAVASARILQQAVVPRVSSISSIAKMEGDRLRIYLWRATETNDRGEVSLPSFPGEQILRATSGDMVSRPWRGEARREVTLTLETAFTVGGMLTLPADAGSAGGEERIVLQMRWRGSWLDLEHVRGVKEGPWGPVVIPWAAGVAYRFRFESARFVPVAREFAAPPPGGHVALDIRPETPAELWFFVQDESGEAVKDGVVSLKWGVEGEGGSLEALARPDGYVYVGNAPRGAVTYWASAPGFSPSHTNTILNPLPEPTSLVVVLQRAGLLTGHCLHDGKPVEDFEVVFWVPQSSGQNKTRVFHGRVDGSFSIPDAPIGPLLVTASSPEHPGCEPVWIDIQENEPTDVTLALEMALTGRGTVVDAETGSPLPEATVQIHVSGGGQELAPWGPPFPVRADGSFEIAGFTARQTFYTVRAAGHSDHFAAVIPETGKAVDLGRIALSRTQSIHVRLIGGAPEEGGSGYAGYTLRARGPREYFFAGPDASGTFRMEDASAGSYELGIKRPDETVYLAFVKVKPGEEWSYDLRVAGEKRLHVRVLNEVGDPIGASVPVDVSYTTSSQVFVLQRAYTTESGEVSFPGIEAERIEVEVLKSDLATVLARACASFSGSPELSIDVSLGGRTFRVRVVDETGRPVSQAKLRLADPDDPRTMHVGITDGQGVCSLLGVEERVYAAHLSHEKLGNCFGLSADATKDEIELVFTSGAELDIVLVDDGRAVMDARCAMWDPWGEVFDARTTDEEGRVHYGPLAPGRYRFRANRTGYWPIDLEAEAVRGGKETRAILPRLGGVTFELSTAEGVAAAGQAIGLWSLDHATDVAEWVGQGRVALAGGLVTDGEGRLAIAGLPHGPYKWEIAGQSGTFVTGRVDVPPG